MTPRPFVRARSLESLRSETFDVVGERAPGATLTLVIHRRDGSTAEVPVTCRLDSDEDVEVYEAGGVLQRFAQDFLARNADDGNAPRATA